MSPLPSFYHASGVIYWRGAGAGTPISAEQARALRAEFKTACRAAYRAGDRDASTAAARRWIELGKALDGHADWLRAARPSAPPVAGFTSSGQAVAHIIDGLAARFGQ